MIFEAKIELEDAVSGDVIATRTMSGAITDAVKNIVERGDYRDSARYNDFSVGFFSFNSFTNKTIAELLFGGIILFSNNISQDELFLSGTELLTTIAHANQNNSGSNPTMKGTLDSAIIGEDTAKFIYKFDETQGNGTMSALCITSCIGGELGGKIKEIDENYSGDALITPRGTNLELVTEYLDDNINGCVTLNADDYVLNLPSLIFIDTEGDTLYEFVFVETDPEQIGVDDFEVYRYKLSDIKSEKFQLDVAGFERVVEKQGSSSYKIQVGLNHHFVFVSGKLEDKAYMLFQNGAYELACCRINKDGYSTFASDTTSLISTLNTLYTNKGTGITITTGDIEESVSQKNCVYIGNNKVGILCGHAGDGEAGANFIGLMEYNLLTGSTTYNELAITSSLGDLIDFNNLGFSGIGYASSGYVNTEISFLFFKDEIYLWIDSYVFLVAAGQIYSDPCMYMPMSKTNRLFISTITRDILREEPYVGVLSDSRTEFTGMTTTEEGNALTSRFLKTHYIGARASFNSITKTSGNTMTVTIEIKPDPE